MIDLTIDSIDLIQLVTTAVVNNDKQALNTYKNIIECMIEKHDYECRAHNDELHLMEDHEITQMQLISYCLDKLITDINKAL